jgi:hypothetical protein
VSGALPTLPGLDLLSYLPVKPGSGQRASVIFRPYWWIPLWATNGGRSQRFQ